jgi:cytochrome P450
MLAGNRAYFFDRLVKDFGDFVFYRGLFNFYLVNHPALVKRVLQETNKSFDKRSVIYDRFRHVFGDGLVVAEGDRWKRQRKLMQPMFVPGAVKQFFEIMVDASQQMLARWERRRPTQSVFNVADEMSGITLEIAGRALFHDGFHNSADQIRSWTETINHYSAKPPLPIVRSPWFPSRTNRQLKRALIDLHTFLRKMIAKRREKQGEQDLLSILMETRHEESGEPMSDVEVMDEVLGMIIGGHETSSSALAWLWYELNRHPHVQQKLFDEVDSVVGKRELTLAELPQLRYARMVIEETLRLHPPFWFENRNVAQAVELGGVTLPPGAVVLSSRYSLHRHAEFWTRPDEFDPNRFAPDQEENSRASCAHVPFGGGPRICIGINFAMLELIAILTIVSQRFRVVVDESDRHRMAAHLTMTPAFGVRVRLEDR